MEARVCSLEEWGVEAGVCRERRELMGESPGVSLAHLLAAREDVAIVEKVGDSGAPSSGSCQTVSRCLEPPPGVTLGAASTVSS